MTHLIAEIILAAGNSDEESTFWIQMLVLVVLGGVVGIVSLIKARAKRFKTQKEQHRSVGSGGPYSQRGRQIKAVKDKYVEFFLKTARQKTNTKEPMLDFETAGKVGGGKQKTERDLNSGMEILDLDFLVKVVENTKGRSKKDVQMRKLIFNELLRRDQLSAVDSKKLRIYTVNKRKLYDKKIQSGAMKALAERTKPRS
ncbi:MAG: hypothetical protein ACYS9C_15140 [Planctomycetota bacterium]|jgi:hypothetical protein